MSLLQILVLIGCLSAALSIVLVTVNSEYNLGRFWAVICKLAMTIVVITFFWAMLGYGSKMLQWTPT